MAATASCSTRWMTAVITKAHRALQEQEAEAHAAWQRGELSPLKFLMYRYRLDEPALAMVTGLWQWRIRRHFRPAIYRKLSPALLARYAEAFGLPVEQLISYQKGQA
jgi:hypothetical protein